MKYLNAGDADVVQFIDDDAGYVNWLARNPTGYVVNSHRQPTSNYLILHHAGCRHINNPNQTNWTTTGYIKTCSTDLRALREWAEEVTGGRLKPCGACQPDADFPPHSVSAPAPERPSPGTTPSTDVVIQQPVTHRTQPTGKRSIPAEISTGCPELDLVWRKFAADILNRPHVLIPDTEEDLNWHAFLGHSIDMQGFRAAEFAGVDPLSKPAPGFVPLKARGIGVVELASLWEIEAIRNHLLRKTHGQPFAATLDALRSKGGTIGRSLAEALATFPFRKFHSTVRALLQNSAVLKECGFSFRNWLQKTCSEVGVKEFPPANFRQRVPGQGDSIEMMLRHRLEETFYQVGPAMAPYMLCDWQLWLWNEGKTAVFASFKLDSFHEEFVRKYGRDVIPTGESAFAEWWLSLYPDLPPRLANECIWLGIEHGIV